MMDNVNYDPRMLKRLIDLGTMAGEPLQVLDVGCAGGIDPVWRLFGNDLRVVGFDAQGAEVQRLQEQEMHPGVEYVAAYIGLPADHPFVARRAARRTVIPPYYDPWERLSTAVAQNQGLSSRQPQSNSLNDGLVEDRFSLADFVRRRGLSHVDFVKIDTDGYDLEAALSAEEIIRSHDVLGFMIETPFIGSHDDTENNFANIDKFMKQNGFMLYAMTVNKYSRSALPQKFVYNILAHTVEGQPVWGDLVYLRDGAANDYAAVWGKELTPVKLIKLACLYELFCVPDCAAELLLRVSDRVRMTAPVDELLNLLTPLLKDEQLTHSEYVARFQSDIEKFFPD